jgi:7-cyano-7-deazaguanine reductase
MTGHPDFGRITLRYGPDEKCVELKSLKLYYQSFRDEGIFYEAVTNRIRDDLVALLEPRWLQITSQWRGRGGMRSRIVAGYGGMPGEG